MKVKIGSIVIYCYEFDKMLAFWRQALHYVPREPPKDGFVILHDPAGRGRISHWTKSQKSAREKEAGCISTFIRQTRRAKWSGSSISARFAIPGDTGRTATLSSWKIPTAISFALFRSPAVNTPAN